MDNRMIDKLADLHQEIDGYIGMYEQDELDEIEEPKNYNELVEVKWALQSIEEVKTELDRRLEVMIDEVYNEVVNEQKLKTRG